MNFILENWTAESIGLELTYIILLMAVVFLTRLPWIMELSSDFYTQLWLQKQFRESNKWIKPIYIDSIIPNAVSFYPPFPASFLARLPNNLVVPVGILANYFFDAVSAIFIYVLMRYQNIDLLISLLSSLLWACLPVLHPVNARLVGIGSRTLGPLLFLMWSLATFFSLEGFWFIGGIGMLIFSAATILSSQMAIQNILLQSMVISFAYLNPLPLLGTFGGLVISLIIGQYDLISLKLVHIRWYLAHGRKFLLGRNNLILFINKTKKNPIIGLTYLAESTTPGVLLTGFIGLIPLIIPTGELNIDGHPTTFLFFCFVVIAGAIIGSALTLKGPLEIFGESERYLEYASPFIVVTLVLISISSALIQKLQLGIILCLLGIFFNLILMRAAKIYSILRNNGSFEDTEEIRKILEPLGDRRIATSPMFLASKLSVELGDVEKYKFLHILLFDKETGQLPWPTDVGKYPYLDTRPDFLDKYKIDTIIILRSQLKYLPKFTDINHLQSWQRWSTDTFEIFTR